MRSGVMWRDDKFPAFVDENLILFIEAVENLTRSGSNWFSQLQTAVINA